jgi:hypothetical protein
MSYCINKFNPNTLIKTKEHLNDEANGKEPKDPHAYQDFRMVMLAPSKKGKTVFVLALISSHLIKVYKHIFIIIPNRNSAYAGFIWPNHFLLANSKDDVDKQVTTVIKYATKLTANNIDNNRHDRILLIFDDLGDTARFSLEVPKIFSMGRNINISAMFLAQTFSAVPSSLRPNVTHYCAFTYIMKDAEMIYSNSNSPITKKDFTTTMRRFFESNKDTRRVLIISVENVELSWYEASQSFVERYKNRYNAITRVIDPRMNFLQYQYSIMNSEESKHEENIFV